MTPAERLSEARVMVILAEEFQARGFPNAAGEMLWGAVNHIIAAIVDHHRLLMNNGRPMKRRPEMDHLQNVNPRTPPLEDSFAVVQGLHGHFYNGHMSDIQHATAMSATFDLVAYLLNRSEVQVIS